MIITFLNNNLRLCACITSQTLKAFWLENYALWLKTEVITVLSETCEEGILALKKSLESQFTGIDNNLKDLIYFAASYKKVKLNEPFFPKNSFTYYNESSYQFFLFS